MNRKEIMRKAWELFRWGQEQYPFGLCLHMAWSLAKADGESPIGKLQAIRGNHLTNDGLKAINELKAMGGNYWEDRHDRGNPDRERHDKVTFTAATLGLSGLDFQGYGVPKATALDMSLAMNYVDLYDMKVYSKNPFLGAALAAMTGLETA